MNSFEVSYGLEGEGGVSTNTFVVPIEPYIPALEIWTHLEMKKGEENKHAIRLKEVENKVGELYNSETQLTTIQGVCGHTFQKSNEGCEKSKQNENEK